MRFSKNNFLIFIALLAILFLTGCGVSKEQEEAMFNILKEEGYLKVGDRSYEDYDEKRVVDQSPIPVNFTYYDYISDDVTYTIRYDHKSKTDDGEYYYAMVEEKGTELKHTNYIFTESKFFKKMELIDKE